MYLEGAGGRKERGKEYSSMSIKNWPLTRLSWAGVEEVQKCLRQVEKRTRGV